MSDLPTNTSAQIYSDCMTRYVRWDPTQPLDSINATILKHTIENARPLQPLKLRVDTVATAEQMLALHEHGKFDYSICIVDERLDKAGGELLGSEGVTEMKKRLARSASGSDPSANNGTKFVHCSGNCSQSDREKYLAAGAHMVW